MVSHAVWKTWPSGLSYDKNLGLRPRFLSTESLGPCFSHGMGDHDQILQHFPHCHVLKYFILPSNLHIFPISFQATHHCTNEMLNFSQLDLKLQSNLIQSKFSVKEMQLTLASAKSGPIYTYFDILRIIRCSVFVDIKRVYRHLVCDDLNKGFRNKLSWALNTLF